MESPTRRPQRTVCSTWLHTAIGRGLSKSVQCQDDDEQRKREASESLPLSSISASRSGNRDESGYPKNLARRVLVLGIPSANAEHSDKDSVLQEFGWLALQVPTVYNSLLLKTELYREGCNRQEWAAQHRRGTNEEAVMHHLHMAASFRCHGCTYLHMARGGDLLQMLVPDGCG